MLHLRIMRFLLKISTAFSVMLLLLSINSTAQNLVPNGDFELGPDSLSYGWTTWLDSNCINDTPMPGPDSWTVSNLTPDRQVDTDPQFPTGCRDTTYAKSGNAYIIVAADVVSQDEAGKATLTLPLKKDSIYRLSYYLSMQTYGNDSTLHATVKFNFNNGGDTIVSPTFTTKSWQFVDTVFTASANSTEIEVAFSSTSVGDIGGANIDDIVLSKQSNTAIKDIYHRKRQIKIYPNPSTGTFYLDCQRESNVVVYNAFGEKINSYSVPNKTQSHRFDLSAMPSGIYYIQIQTPQSTIIKKLLLTP